MPEAGEPVDSRDRVCAGAYECIARFGLAKTTVDDVARASRVSRATIYRMFPGGRDQVLRFRTNLDEWAEAGPQRPIRIVPGDLKSGPRPYVLVRDGLEALIARPVFYELVALAQPKGEGAQEMGVWSKGAFFPLSAPEGSD